MMKLLLVTMSVCFGFMGVARAQELGPGPAPDPTLEMFDREPAAIQPPSHRRNYPGSADEDDLRVMPALPEAPLKTNARILQREVFKRLYNQELKEDSQNDSEE